MKLELVQRVVSLSTLSIGGVRASSNNHVRTARPSLGPQVTTTVVPMVANSHMNAASSGCWRWQPPDRRVPSSSVV